MTDTEKERQPMKRARVPFDESKLTPSQKEALAVARSQGKKLVLSRDELVAHMDPQAVEDLMTTVMELRKQVGKFQDPE